MAKDARQAAVEALIRIHRDGGYSHLVWETALGRQGWKEEDAAFASRLLYGVLERRLTLDYVLASHSSLKLKKLHPAVLEILRTGAYQLLYMDRVPASAAVNEAVKLARAMRQERSCGYVNAVLRAVDRDRAHLFDRLPPGEAGLAVRTSCPEPLLALWRRAYGAEMAERLAESANEPPPAYIRINTLKTTQAAFLREAEKAGLRLEAVPSLPGCIRVENPAFLKKLAPAAETWYYHQDMASQLCCKALNPRPGERIADVCAAPGGKSLTAAQYMENRGEILASDLYAAKCEAMEKRAGELGAGIIRTAARDAASPCPEPLRGRFDRVICDVPCSGLGVIRRKPEIRYKPLETFAGLPETQYAILCRAAEMVRRGGVLQYSTCTLNPAENEAVTARFLAEHPDFAPRPLPLGADLWRDGGLPYQLTLFPPVHGTDGFYIAGFVRRSSDTAGNRDEVTS
ncbi:MAG TPA: 16S rRNA (cytosine(967)-C(5))-methyltransferase RsmB [Firmicutes bacterium]|nr:16S rRNA (cytosine(967)-C(5))-methyltransferase RsmB [Bacillota bacterium]